MSLREEISSGPDKNALSGLRSSGGSIAKAMQKISYAGWN
jgi:hypothetical protein